MGNDEAKIKEKFLKWYCMKNFISHYFDRIKLVVQRPITVFDVLADKGHLAWMPDKLYLSLRFRSYMGYWMDWKNPKTFNEKIQWLKIHDRNPSYSCLVDKYSVRNYVSQKIGNGYLIPILGVWENVDEIEFDKLPNQFVLKCSHDSGSVIICKDKSTFDVENAKMKLAKALKLNFYYPFREWPYKNVKPRIIAEKYLTEHEGSSPKDYKIFCFGGVSKFIQVDSDRFKTHTRDIYNTAWKKQDFCLGYPSSKKKCSCPQKLIEMLKLSEILSQGMLFVRCDWYCIQERVYFGEMTFYPAAGLKKFTPKEWDFKFGNLIEL